MLRFDNAFIRELPGDPHDGPRSRQVHGALWSAATPVAMPAPRLLALSADMAARLGLSLETLRAPPLPAVLAGNALLPGMQTWAANYGGHQFGVWAGQLGDGRAISLGESVTAAGERWEWQLKGAGPTPYSRHADGRAVLRSSLREFVCSEAMHHLGVPTTRALSLVASGEEVVRDLLYSGDPRPEPGAIVCRLAPSFLRFGSFELPASRGDAALLRTLVDFTLRRDFPHLAAITDAQERLSQWFDEVCRSTAALVAHWMRLGFVHGVLNTDNMSILGLCIDYGPFGWIDDYDPDWTPNTTDAGQRRYRFGSQPTIGGWNLSRLASAIAPLFAEHAPLHAGLDSYVAEFERLDRRHAAAKLGLLACEEADLARLQATRDCLHEGEIDMTLFFRLLADMDEIEPTLEGFAPAFYDADKRRRVEGRLLDCLRALAARWREEARPAALRRAAMNACNPCYVPRNYLLQQVIDRVTTGDPGALDEAMAVFSRPYEAQPGREAWAARRPQWARDRPGCSMLSCSS